MQNVKWKNKNVELKNSAVIIADVHYKRGDREFLDLLKSWIKNPPPQVFLLGDIFHLLLPFSFLIQYNKEAIELINLLSKKTEVYYTPGNHDFNIEQIFPNVVFADAFYDKNRDIFLSHGDLTCTKKDYLIYAAIIRNDLFLNFLNIVTINFINNWLFKKLLNKPIKCKKIENFEKIIKKKLKLLDYDIIIEGHYHQNLLYNGERKSYYSLNAFFCTKSYYIIQIENHLEIKEKRYD